MAKPAKNADFAFELIEDQKALDKAILSIQTRGKGLQKDVHIAACSVLNKVINNGDVRIVDKLIDACPDMTRRNDLRFWFEHFGPMTFAQNKAKYLKRDEAKDLLPKAMKTPFWVLKPEPEYVPFDYDKVLASLQKKLTTDSEKTGADHTEFSTLLTEFLAKRAKAAAAVLEPDPSPEHA